LRLAAGLELLDRGKSELTITAMTFVAWSGVLDGVVAIGGPVTVLMGSLVFGLLAATTLALVLRAERTPVRRAPVVVLRSTSSRDRAAAA
jgi:hypothetical protein